MELTGRRRLLFSFGFAFFIATLSCVFGSGSLRAAVVSASAAIVNKSSLAAPFRLFLQAMGDRLAVPGNERLMMTGTVTLADRSTTNAVVTLELPDHVRYEQASPHHVVVYDGTQVQTNSGPPVTADINLVESFALDGVERFLVGQSQRIAFRALGHHLRLVESLSKSKGRIVPVGPSTLCDAYQTMEVDRFAPGTPLKPKSYCFEEGSGLLASTHYLNAGATTKVHTTWSGWSKTGHNQIPGQIARYENGGAVFTFTVRNGVVSPLQNDGIFSKP